MQKGDSVTTPGGVGQFQGFDGNMAIVEMDFSYQVEYSVSEVKPYPLQKEVRNGEDKS